MFAPDAGAWVPHDLVRRARGRCTPGRALGGAVLALLLAGAPRADAAFPVGTANVVVDSVNAAVEQDVFTYTSDVADRIYIRLTVTSGNLQPALGIHKVGTLGGGGGQSIGPVFDAGFAAFTMAATDYQVSVPWQVGGAIGIGSGSYRLYFQSAANPGGAVAITPGQEIAGSLAQPGQIDTYTFTGNAGDKLRIRTHRTSGLVDPDLAVYTGSPNTAGALGTRVIPCAGTEQEPTDNPEAIRILDLPATARSSSC